MNLRKFAVTLVLCILFTPVLALAGTPGKNQNAHALAQYGSLPLSFEPNVGQLHSPDASAVRFLTRGQGYAAFLTNSEAIIRVGREPALIRMQLVGANAVAAATGENPLSGKVNYLFGKNPQLWHTDIPTFSKVRFREVYDGIDLVYYGNQRKLEYDFVVAPGANPGSIRMKLEGADKLRVDKRGDLLMTVGNSKMRWRKPLVYQNAGKRRQNVAGRYALLDNNEIAFVLGRYDRSRALVIDPALVYSTYLGGSKGVDDPEQTSGGSDRAVAVAVDGSGNAYVLGSTDAVDFPTTAGAYQTTAPLPPGCDPRTGCASAAFVSKLNAAGTALMYSTYLADIGSGASYALAVDSGGRAYATYSYADSTSTEGSFLDVLNSTGSALAFRMGFGEGNVVRALTTDSSGIAYVAGETFGSLPVTGNAFQPSFGGDAGGSDAFVMKIDRSQSGSAAILYSSYLGGGGNDRAFGISHSSGKTYVSGQTRSADFPTTAGAFQRALHGTNDGFVAKFDLNQSGAASLAYSTLVGGGNSDVAQSVAVNSNGQAFVYGATTSSNFPTTSGAFQRTTGGTSCFSLPCSDVFVTKFNSTGSGLVYSTLVRGSGDDGTSPDLDCCFTGNHIALDSFNNAYIVGETDSTNFPTTPNALRRTNGSGDGFFAKVNSTGSGLNFGTYLGGTSVDFANSIAVRGHTYIVGQTFSTNFPTVSTAFQQSRRGPNDAFVMKFSFPACTVSNTNRTVTICTPAAGGSVKSPVHVIAQTTDTQQVTSLHISVDGVKKFQANANSLDTLLSMSSGTHRITVVAKDATGYYWKTVNIAVQ